MSRWVEACQDFTPCLRAALDDGSDLAMLQCVLDLLELPTRVLVPLLEEKEQQKQKRARKPPPPPDMPDASHSSIKARQEAAKRRAYEDSWAKGLQALLSNGAATESSATLRIMQDMHPPRTEPLNMHAPPAARPEVSAAQAGSFLYMTAANDSTCVDVFGWASDFLFHVRATGFKHQLARLTARVGNADVSDTVAMVLTCCWRFTRMTSPSKRNARARVLIRNSGLSTLAPRC